MMTKEQEIKILMADNCTKSEAEKHLKDGTIIYEDLEENLDVYLKEYDDEEFTALIKDMIKKKDGHAIGWGVVEENGKTYYINYVL